MGYFSNIYSQDNNRGVWEVKHALIKEARLMEGNGAVYFIGDTEADVVAAQKLGAVSIAVESGIRTRELLENMNPDIIIPDISHLESVIP